MLRKLEPDMLLFVQSPFFFVSKALVYEARYLGGVVMKVLLYIAINVEFMLSALKV